MGKFPYLDDLEEDQRTTLAVAISIAIYLLTLLSGTACFGVATWILVERNFYSDIFGTTLIEVSAYLISVGGGLALLFSFVGCLGGCCKSRWIIMLHLIAIVGASVAMITGAILSIVYQVKVDQNPQYAINHMRDVIQKSYGINLHQEYYRKITDSWDQTQSKLWCCSAEDNSWSVYRGSEWFKLQPGVIEYDRALVPPSCCVKDQYGRYISLQKCQTWPSGPPTIISGQVNECLYYRGCYTAVKEFSKMHSSYLIGIGLAMGILMIPDIVVSLWLFTSVIKPRLRTRTIAPPSRPTSLLIDPQKQYTVGESGAYPDSDGDYSPTKK